MLKKMGYLIIKINVESRAAKVLICVLTIAFTFIAPIIVLGNQYESKNK